MDPRAALNLMRRRRPGALQFTGYQPRVAACGPAAATLLLLRRRRRKPAAEAADLMAAIKDRFAGSAVATLCPGGIYRTAGGRRSGPPYVLVEETGASLKIVTSTSTIHDTRVRLKIYCPNQDDDQDSVIGDAVEDLFTGAALEFTGGWTTPWVRHDRKHLIDRALSKNGAEVPYLLIEFVTRVKR